MSAPAPSTLTVDLDGPHRARFNEKYIQLFERRDRFLHLYGSAGSGKSVFACQKEIVMSFAEYRRGGRKTLVVRKIARTISESIYSQLVSTIYDFGWDRYFKILKSPPLIINLETDVKFIFFGLDNAEKLKSVQGVDRALIEEATELQTRSELEQVSLRARGFSNIQITLCYNPINIFHWLNTEFHQTRPAGHFFFILLSGTTNSLMLHTSNTWKACALKIRIFTRSMRLVSGVKILRALFFQTSPHAMTSRTLNSMGWTLAGMTHAH